MRYANQIEFKNTTGTVKEVIDALQDFPKNYHCYIRNVDSIYPITDVDDDALGDNELGFSSIETYGTHLKSDACFRITYNFRAVWRRREQLRRYESICGSSNRY